MQRMRVVDARLSRRAHTMFGATWSEDLGPGHQAFSGASRTSSSSPSMMTSSSRHPGHLVRRHLQAPDSVGGQLQDHADREGLRRVEPQLGAEALPFAIMHIHWRRRQ